MNHGREAGALNAEVPSRTLRAQVARTGDSGVVGWSDAESVRLVANPAVARALREDASGVSHPREDTALPRVSPAPAAHFELSPRTGCVSEQLSRLAMQGLALDDIVREGT
jgi:hypothetical protein